MVIGQFRRVGAVDEFEVEVPAEQVLDAVSPVRERADLDESVPGKLLVVPWPPRPARRWKGRSRSLPEPCTSWEWRIIS